MNSIGIEFIKHGNCNLFYRISFLLHKMLQNIKKEKYVFVENPKHCIQTYTYTKIAQTDIKKKMSLQ